MTKSFKKGDEVSWNSSQGKVQGTIVGTITGRAEVKGHEAHASKEHPEYRVKSDKTGAEAIHKPEALTKK